MLRRPGAVLLLSCYELGHQPLSLASPLGLLHEAGYEPTVVDLSVEPLRPEPVAAARFAALAVPMHTALRLGIRAAGRIRALNPHCHLCFYGLYASLNAATLLERGADSIIGGEYEEPLLRLVESLDRGAASPVPGVQTRAHRQPPWVRRIRLAVPRRDPLPPLARYARLELGGEKRLAGQTEASRGCRHACRHCPIPPVYGGRFFVVPRDLVLEDVRRQVRSGAAHITFGDPDFLNGPGHSLGVVRALRAEHPKLTFDCTAKIEHLLKHRDRLEEMASLGCLFIVSAVESLNDTVLAALDKGHDRGDVKTALDLVRAAGMRLRPSFVPFTPWSGLQDFQELLDFIAREDLIDDLDPVQLSIRLLIPPGSLLADRPEMRIFLGPLDAERFTYVWTHPDQGMDRLQLDVARLVERAARTGEDARVTFERIAGLADRAVGGRDAIATPARPVLPAAAREAGRPPRLTEPWFC